MSAPSTDLLALAASTTSSGFADGLGRRVLAFDREEGAMLERLTIRPELAAFESMLRERVDRVATLEDERIARPRTVERDSEGALIVVSEFVPGSRLADLLDTSADQGSAPGVDAAFGFLLDVLPALCGLHAGAGFPHGTIAPSRIVLTPAGQVVLLDPVYGGALSHLRYSRRRLWLEFGVATPASAGAPRLDVQSDIAQVVLAGVMLVLGRPMYVDEYPVALPRVLKEVIEIAQIRGSAAFASGFQSFLERALPLPNRRPYAAADDALIDLRDLASELGMHECRRALIDFIEEMEPSGTQPPAANDFDDVLADIEAFGRTGGAAIQDTEGEDDEDLESGDEAEIDLEELVEEPLYDLSAVTEIEIPAEDLTYDDNTILAWPGDQRASVTEPRQVESEVVAAVTPASPAPFAAPESVALPSPVVHEPAPPDPVYTPIEAAPIPVPFDPPAIQAAPAASDEEDVEEDQTSQNNVRSRRAKRTRSARARKDKLRSAAAPAPPLVTQKKIEPIAKPEEIEKVEPPPEPKKATGSWLVAPDRAAAFEPAGPEDSLPAPPVAAPKPPAPMAPPPPAPQYQPFAQSPPSHVDSFLAPPPPVPPPVPASTFAPPPPPVAWSPTPVVPAPPAAPAPQIKLATASTQLTPVKLKERPRVARTPPPATDIWATPTAPPVKQEEASAFPWKLAAAALVVMGILIVGGRSLLPEKGAVEETPRPASTTSTKTTPASAPKTVALPTPTSEAGRLEIETQPAGARILLDGKPAGESPLTMESVPVGRHTVTFVSPSGSVKRTIRIEAGRTVKLDVPIFSGWVGIFAPFVVEVSEGGRVIGTTEESRLMLSPGHHELTLTNRELGYKSVQSVEIEPGEVRSITLEPRGSVNLNATPWAEVFIEGQKVGDTPIANLQLPLGIREIVFRHPQFGERRTTVTVKGNAPAALSVDMSKP